MQRTASSFLRIPLAMVLLIGTMALAQEPTPTPPPPPPEAPPSTPPAPTKPAAAANPPAAMVDSLKIVCDGTVKSDGVTTLIFTPKGGEPKEIRVTLQKGMKDRDVCRDVAKELSVALSGAPYSVDPSGDKVKVKGKKNAEFSLTLGSQTSTGVTILMK